MGMKYSTALNAGELFPCMYLFPNHHRHFTFTQCGWLMSVAGESDCKHTCLLIYPFPHHHRHLRHPHHLNHYISFAYLSHHTSSSPPLSSLLSSISYWFFSSPASWRHHYCPHPYLSDLKQPHFKNGCDYCLMITSKCDVTDCLLPQALFW